jgi:hypothetical protein
MGKGLTKPNSAAPDATPEINQEWDAGQKAWEAKPRPKFPQSFKSDENGALTISAESEAHQTIDAALGSNMGDFQGYCLTNLANILSASGQTDFTLPMNAALAMLTAIAPQNELEAMLAVQMVATHHLALKTARLASLADNPLNRQLNSNLNTKFSRTFTAQLEALGRHRRGGKQVVEHVHVNAGGQAVIAGTVNTGRGS